MHVPDGWSLNELDNLCSKIAVGLAVSVTPYMRSDGVQLIRNQNIRSNGFSTNSIVYIDKKFASANKSKKVKQGDVIAVRTGSNIGEACVVPKSFDGALTFTTLIARPKPTLLDSFFLSTHINSEKGISEVNRLMAGGGKPNLNSGELKRYKILTPSLPEQQKIAQILSTWDKAIEKLEALIAAKQKRKKALMQQLLTGKTRFAGFEGGWTEVRLGDLLKGKKCKGKIVTTNSEFKGLPYIGSTSFEGVFGLYSDSDEAITCTSTDILILWDGENAGKVTTNLTGVVSSTVVRCRLNANKANNQFIAYCLLKDNYKIRAIREGSGIPHMPGDFEHWYELQLPTIEEQQKIASFLSAADKEIQTHQKQLSTLKQQKKGLMQQLLTGKKRVKLAESA